MYTVTVKPKYIERLRCDDCGEETVEVRYWCRWDVDKQQYIPTDKCEEYGYEGYCATCGDIVEYGIITEEVNDPAET